MAVLTISPIIGFDMTGGIFPEGEILRIHSRSSTEFAFSYIDEHGNYAEDRLFGSSLSYSWWGELVGGVVTGDDWYLDGELAFSLRGADVAVEAMLFFAFTGDVEGELAYVFRGEDTITGNRFEDVLLGFGGRDSIAGGDGADGIYGGSGDDYLRGEAGNDFIDGGDGADDLNGNTGDDLIFGGFGDDWVVGGQHNDELYGEAGFDIVLGNLGDDFASGGEGADWVRGGQGDDVLRGGAGDDYLSGDRGSDTLSGGLGADVFHSFGEAGLDRVLDFSRAEGDRVQLDSGTTYTVSQSGADILINMSGGGQVVLAGVSMASLTGDWIVAG